MMARRGCVERRRVVAVGVASDPGESRPEGRTDDWPGVGRHGAHAGGVEGDRRPRRSRRRGPSEPEPCF